MATREHSKQLTNLLDTTQSAASEIRDFLVNAKVASERLEQIILVRNAQDARQAEILETMEGRSVETQGLFADLSQQQKSFLARLRDTVNGACNKVHQISSIHKNLENWIKTIVQYCKDIISMVQRNTRLLLSLYEMLAKLERTLSIARVDLPILEFENPFGIKMALPWQLCETWEVRRTKNFARLLS